jgi:putative hydrolase of the HAD superfamily
MREFGSGRNPVTIHDAWETLQKEFDIPHTSIPHLHYLIASSLRRKFPSTVPGTEELLEWAQPRFTLALLASGNPELERQKLEAAKIGGFFKQVRILPSKGMEDLLALMLDTGFNPRNSWIIGSSMHSDIHPAIAAGANCIHFICPRPKLNGAPDEAGEPPGPAFRIHDLLDAKAILAKPGST